eukprot:TRINITY_DN3218_c0_g2_i5.p1 TRINITY_DN3218_c0_g2~~TRINITY_DN3218_c0_g2_i5.p1  ORF type:complete len:271 (+),score=30.95 TRINITY_DN3218_c0_g2_i5:154-966(+)
MLFETLIRWLGQFERHLTKTDSFISVSNKLTLNLFINTSVVLYIATATHSENYWGRGGLLENTGWLFMSNFVLVRLLSLFNPAHYYRKYQRSKLEADATYMNLIQSEANELFEDEPFDVATRYANNLNTLYFAAFYASMFPLGLILGLIDLGAGYWIDKYILLRRSAWPPQIGSKLAEEMMSNLKFLPLVFVVGNMSTNSMLGTWSFLNGVSLIVALVYFFRADYDFIGDGPEGFRDINTPYQTARQKFATVHYAFHLYTSYRSMTLQIQ